MSEAASRRKIHGMSGKKHSPETRLKISMAVKQKHTPEVRTRMSILKKGKSLSEDHKRKISNGMLKGELSPNWIKDRTTLAKKQERNDYAYCEWRKQVWLRDNFTCKIANPDCKGKIEAHHILGWTEYPELRYQVNNGITLCHAHHPRKRAEEKRLSPYFQELVSVSKE